MASQASLLSESSRKRPHSILEIVLYVDPVVSERKHHISKLGNRFAKKPPHGTPRIVFSRCDQAVLDRIVVRVVQACEVALLIGETRVAITVPDFASGFAVLFVQPNGRSGMKRVQHWLEAIRVFRCAGDEVIVICHDCPCFQLPAKGDRLFEQGLQQEIPLLGRVEQHRLLIRPGSNEIRGVRDKQVRRGVGPVRKRCVGITMTHDAPLECGRLRLLSPNRLACEAVIGGQARTAKLTCLCRIRFIKTAPKKSSRKRPHSKGFPSSLHWASGFALYPPPTSPPAFSAAVEAAEGVEPFGVGHRRWLWRGRRRRRTFRRLRRLRW